MEFLLDFFENGSEGIASTLTYVAYIMGGIVVVLFIVKSLILNYHWKKYGITKEQISKLRKIYFGVATVLISIMVISAIFMAFSN